MHLNLNLPAAKEARAALTDAIAMLAARKEPNGFRGLECLKNLHSCLDLAIDHAMKFDKDTPLRPDCEAILRGMNYEREVADKNGERFQHISGSEYLLEMALRYILYVELRANV